MAWCDFHVVHKISVPSPPLRINGSYGTCPRRRWREPPTSTPAARPGVLRPFPPIVGSRSGATEIRHAPHATRAGPRDHFRRQSPATTPRIPVFTPPRSALRGQIIIEGSVFIICFQNRRFLNDYVHTMSPGGWTGGGGRGEGHWSALPCGLTLLHKQAHVLVWIPSCEYNFCKIVS